MSQGLEIAAINQKEWTREDKMKHTRSIGLIVLILALSSVSMALQLSGSTGRTTLQNVANDTFNQTINARAPENFGEIAGGAVLEKVVNILNQTFNATEMPPGNLSEPSGGTEVLENVTKVSNQTLNATEMPPGNLSETPGGAVLEMAANESQNRTSIAPAVSRPNLSGGLGKTILSRLVTNQTINASAASDADLWGWGTVPKGSAVNETGKLVRVPSEEWTPGI
jgi:hypothetical protein